jgi:galactokinase
MATPTDIAGGLLHPIYPTLYGTGYSTDLMDRRYSALIEEHTRLFGSPSPALYSTAGRSELGGNHTDHNLGEVIAATIDLDTIGAVSPRDDNIVVLISEGYPAVEVDLSHLEVVEMEKNTTEALVRGIAFGFAQRGKRIGGWQANTTSRVLKGSGLSSSAAVEMLCATIFNHLYNDDALSTVELALISKFSENHYFGKPSGLMDQLACGYGGIIGIDFKDEAQPKITSLEVSFAEFGYHLVIVDTGGNHADLTDEYATIPTEMRSVSAHYGQQHLRNVDPQQFWMDLGELRRVLNNDRALLRAIHFFEENRRVEEMLAALKAHEIQTYLSLVQESGESSFCFLQNLYPSTFAQEQGLSLAIARTKALLGPKTAVRVHGGGFAGTIQVYLTDEQLGPYTEAMEALFGSGCVTPIAIRQRSSACIAT